MDEMYNEALSYLGGAWYGADEALDEMQVKVRVDITRELLAAYTAGVFVWRAAQREPRAAPARPEPEPEERGFEGVGDFYSDDPYDRYLAHQAAKGRP